jgi:hypothetical protein
MNIGLRKKGWKKPFSGVQLLVHEQEFEVRYKMIVKVMKESSSDYNLER